MSDTYGGDGPDVILGKTASDVRKGSKVHRSIWDLSKEKSN